MNKRIKRALELRRNGLSFINIGQDLVIGAERARQIVRKYERYLESMADPFTQKLKN